MRWTASKYALLTFLLTPFFPAKVLFSQLYFVTDAHSVWSISNKEVEVEKHPDWFSPYCNPGLLRIWRSVIYSALLLPTFPQMTLLDGEPRALPPDSEMKRMPGTALFPRCAPVIPVLWCNCHAVSHFVLFF